MRFAVHGRCAKSPDGAEASVRADGRCGSAAAAGALCAASAKAHAIQDQTQVLVFKVFFMGESIAYAVRLFYLYKERGSV